MHEHPPICDYEGSDYQTRFWEEGGRAYEDRVEAVALKRLLPESGDLLLDVGAGAGRNTPRYSSFKRVVLLDYSRSQLEQAIERLGQNERYIYVAGDIYRLPFVDGLFDSVTMIRVLHHLVDGPLALQQVRRVMQSSGVFILEFANKRNLKSILRYIFKRQDWNPFALDPVEFAPLNFDLHPKGVESWLRLSGFLVERRLTVSHFRLGLLKRWVPLKLLVSMDSAAQLTGDLWQLSPSIFTRSLAVGETQKPDAGAFFRCPQCGNEALDQKEDELQCSVCHRHWPFKDGIYDFRV
jgi:SAM-dependent methyltransferase